MPVKKPHHTAEKDFIKEEGDDRFTIQPRGLNIVWGNDSRYWKIRDDGAELIQVSWLEVSGVVKIKNPNKYKVKFYVNFKDGSYGWDGTDVLVMAKVGQKGKYIPQPSHLSTSNKNLEPLEITVKESNTDLHFGLYEVWSGKWKKGLEIIKAEISPVAT